MGVAMAWPTARYKAEDVVLARLSDTRRWPQSQSQSRSSGNPAGRRPLSRKEAGLSPLSRGGGEGAGAIGGIAELTVLPLWRLLSSPFRMLFSAGAPAIGTDKGGGGLVPKREERQVDPVDEAKKKFNMVIVAKLRPNGGADGDAAAAAAGVGGEGAAGDGAVSAPPSAPVFNVATYHMPCMFWAPQVCCHAHRHLSELNL